MGIYNNNNTILKVEEFLRNPLLYVEETLKRKAVIILTDDDLNEVAHLYPEDGMFVWFS